MSDVVEADPGPNTCSVTASQVDYTYPGATGRSLTAFDLSFGSGIIGLVGPNGAGKTTFLRILTGLLKPDSGSVLIDGRPVDEFVEAGGLGFLPEEPEFPSYLTVAEFLTVVSLAAGEEGASLERSGHRDWDALLDQPCSALSLGQRKHIALMAARIGSPRLLVLDEPTNGLDPIAVRRLRTDLRSERERGKTILILSHHLDELQRLADQVVFVRDGHVIENVERRRDVDALSDLDGLFEKVFAEVVDES